MLGRITTIPKAVMQPTALNLQRLDSIVGKMDKASITSTISTLNKVLNIVSTSEGYKMRLELRIRVNPPDPRVFKPTIGIFSYGKPPKASWPQEPESLNSHPIATANTLISEWDTFRGYVEQYAQDNAILEGLIQSFEVISDTIRECETCTRILIPVENQFVDKKAIEVFAVN